MMDLANELPLSDVASARRTAMLPGLLRAVRRRRRARVLRRSFAAAVLVGVAVWLGSRPTEPRFPAPAPTREVATGTWTFVHDDPGILDRVSVPTVRRAEWFVDDEGLQELLVEAGREAGIVRRGDEVFVSRAAIDPWPGRRED